MGNWKVLISFLDVGYFEILDIFCTSKFQYINLNELILVSLGYHKLTYSYFMSSITSLLILLQIVLDLAGCHFLLQENLPNPGIEPVSPAWQTDFYHRAIWEALFFMLRLVQMKNIY